MPYLCRGWSNPLKWRIEWRRLKLPRLYPTVSRPLSRAQPPATLLLVLSLSTPAADMLTSGILLSLLLSVGRYPVSHIQPLLWNQYTTSSSVIILPKGRQNHNMQNFRRSHLTVTLLHRQEVWWILVSFAYLILHNLYLG